MIRSSQATALGIVAMVAALCTPLAAKAETSTTTTSVVRRAYQTAQYPESMRRRCALLAMQYARSVDHQKGRAGYARALDAGRAAEQARGRAYSTQRPANPNIAVRRAYQT